MELKHKKSGTIYPFSLEFLSTGRFEIYDKLAPKINELEEDEKIKLKFYCKGTITKEAAEIELETPLSDKEYKDLLKRLYEPSSR